jgi:hypothetical protein
MTETAKFPTMRMMIKTKLALLPRLLKVRGRRKLVTRTLKRLQRRLHIHHLLNPLSQSPRRSLCIHRCNHAALSARERCQ